MAWRRLLFALQFTLFPFLLFSQKATITGKVTDAQTKEPLPGATVKVSETKGTTTNLEGQYTLEVDPGSYELSFTYTGYAEKTKPVTIKAGETKTINMSLLESVEELDIVVVSGSKYSRKLSEETVSIEVIKSDLIQSTNTVTLNEVVDKVAGVSIYDNQITIRGGSGYAYGVGSRVLLLIDGLPLLSVDRSEIRWNFVPIEIAEQVEVLKSASSALYGSAALNGVVNVRTAWPKEEPETEASVYYNGYAKPRKKEAAWWTRTYYHPYRYGGSFSHKQRFKPGEGHRDFGAIDFVAGASLNKSVGYIRLLNPYHARLTFKLRHLPGKVKGLSYGVFVNMMDSHEGDYLFWKNSTDGAYIPFESDDDDDKGTLTLSNRKQIVIDPWVKYFDNTGNKHSLKFRYNYQDVAFTSFPNPYAHMFLTEYQFQRTFDFGLTVTAGTQEQFYWLKDPRDLGVRNGATYALYTQADQKVGRFNASLGLRYEQYKLDQQGTKGRPLLSAGLNYQAGKATYLRASFGQGYRFPGLAERFVDSESGGIRAFPNYDLQPEYGFNSEIGVKQGVKLGDWLAYLDFSFFWYEYWDMIEFEFGIHGADTLPLADRLGFKAKNVTRARIAGYELSVFGEGKIGKVPVNWQGGYTYNYPVDLSSDPELSNFGEYMRLFFKSIGTKPEYYEVTDCNEVTCPMLKYRSRHLFKSDIEFKPQHFIFGVDTRYYSFIEAVDPIFENETVGIPEIKKYRKENQKGEWVLNLRAGYDFDKYGVVTLLVNNATNNFYTIRPARMEAPMNFVIQYRFKI